MQKEEVERSKIYNMFNEQQLKKSVNKSLINVVFSDIRIVQ